MATGAELASAYITLIPSMRGAGKTIADELGSAGGAVESSGKSMGDKLSKGLKYGAAAAATGIAALLTGALVKGFKRLSTIEEAKASLDGLGHSSENVTEIMKNALASVKGTAFGMGEAASTAAGAVAAGIKPGKELERTLKLTGDAATIGGSSISEMGAIFNKIASSGKVTGRELNQLNMQGIPIVQLLGKEMGKTSGEITKMVSKGEVDFETFQNAIEKGMGGAALTSGGTVMGAFANMNAALGRLGASMLEGVFPLFGKGFNLVTKGLDKMTDAVKPVAAAFGVELSGGFLAFGAAFKAADGDITSAGWPGVMERLGFLASKVLPEARGGLTAFVQAFKDGGTDITSSGFAGLLEAVGLAAGNLWKAAGPSLQSLLPALFELWQAFSPLGIAIEALTPLIPQLGDLAGTLAVVLSGVLLAALEASVPLIESLGIIAQTIVVPALEALVPILQNVATWMSENSRVVAVLIGAYAGVKLAMATYKGAAAGVKVINEAVSNSLRSIKVARDWALMAAAAVKSGAETAYVWALYKIESIKAVAAMAVAKAKIVGHWVVMGVQAMVQGARIAAGWLLAMGPVGWIIAGVAALIAGFVAAYNNIGWFKDGVDTALKAVGGFFTWLWESVIQPALGWIVDALKNTGQWFKDVWDGAAKAVQVSAQWIMDAAGNIASFFDKYVAKPVKLALETMGAAFVWLYETIIKPVFDSISVIVNGFYLFFRQVFLIVVEIFKQIIAPAFMNFWHGVVEPVFAGIGNTISSWWAAAKLVFDTAVSFVRGALSAAFTWLRDSVIMPVFNSVQAVISVWWAATKTIFDAVVGFVRGVFSTAFTWFRDSVITPVFNFIKTAVDLWWAATKLIFSAVDSFIRSTLATAFTWFRDSVITPVFNFIKTAIDVWWTATRLIFTTVDTFIRGTLATAFTWFRDSVITPVWNGVRDTIDSVWKNGIKPVFDLLSKAIKDDVPKAFTAGVDAAEKAWDRILDIAKEPVRFMVNTVINDGLIGSMNKLSGLLGIPPLGKVGLPDGFSRGGVLPGYQAAKRDDVMTPMRSGEGVLVPEVVKGLGAGFVHGWNRIGNSGGVQAVKAAAQGMAGYAKGGIVNPLRSMALTQGYNRVHKGIDLAAAIGTPVYATESGRVSLSGPGASAPGISGGNEVHIDGASGIQTWFAHLSSMMVRAGDMVRAGQQIALSGNTGISSGPHLHFGAFNPGWPNDIDPQQYLGGAIQGSGDGGGGGFNPIAALAGMAREKLTAAFPGGGKMVDFAIAGGEKLIGGVSEWVQNKLGSLVDNAVTGVKSVASNVGMRAKWMPMIQAALIKSGHGDLGIGANSESMFRRMMQESGGDPRAINNWDSNAAMGQSSRGLMQVIPSTFEAYRDRSLSSDIFDPLANMVAAIRYTSSRYGNLRKGWDQPGGYAMGGIIPTLYDGGGWLENTGRPQIIDHQRSKPDAVLTNSQWAMAEESLLGRGRGPAKIENHFHELSNPRATAYQVARLQEGLG